MLPFFVLPLFLFYLQKNETVYLDKRIYILVDPLLKIFLVGNKKITKVQPLVKNGILMKITNPVRCEDNLKYSIMKEKVRC